MQHVSGKGAGQHGLGIDTGGQVYASADAGDSWQAILRDLPAVLSVEVQTL